MGVPGRFTLRRCETCGSYGRDPVPSADEILGYYPNNYAPYRQGGRWFEWMATRGMRVRVRHATSIGQTPGRLLDVGCATGRFMALMQAHGWQVQGVELVAEVAQLARTRYGLEVLTGAFDDLPLPEAAYDLVTLWDVLEHVPSPRATLAKIARLLKPGGWLVFRVPNPTSLGARLFGDAWAGWDFPRHLWLAPQVALHGALTREGFSPSPSQATSGRFALFALSVRYLAEKRFGQGRAARLIGATAASPALRMLTWPYFAATGRLARGSVLTHFARKL